MAYDSITAIQNRHDFDKTFTAEYDANQTGATLITPTSGRLLKIAGVHIGMDSTDGSVRVYFSDDENDQINTCLEVYGADDNPGYVPMVIRGDRNAVLKFDSDLGADDNFFILINFKEE